MKKDGVLEVLKSSRLKVCNLVEKESVKVTQNTSSVISKGGNLPSKSLGVKTEGHDMDMDIIPPRVVAEVRAATGNRGIPKSGRVWKRLRSQRFSRIRNDKPDSTTWKDKQNKKCDKVALKSFAQELKDEKLGREKAERDRAAENKRRREENEKKNEVVVPIKNTAKIKRMRKKQLRTIQKR